MTDGTFFSTILVLLASLTISISKELRKRNERQAYAVNPEDPEQKKKVEQWLDSLISRMLSWTPDVAQLTCTLAELRELCYRARELFWSQPMLIEVDAPCKVFGDLHGQYLDLLTLLHIIGYPPKSKLVFLGDYVDRGDFSMECIVLLLAYKVRYPNDVTLLRGNHESRPVNIGYGFFPEVKKRYGRELYELFQTVFYCMPVCARISKVILCMHGGISQDLANLEEINNVERPCDIPDVGPMADFTWSDPDPAAEGYQPSPRGAAHIFNGAEFMKKHHLELIVRAHQMVDDGYEFFHGKKLVTIFSAPCYGGGDASNKAAVLNINAKLQCSFTIFERASPK